VPHMEKTIDNSHNNGKAQKHFYSKSKYYATCYI